MTICEKCGEMMKIIRAIIDLGEADEEFEFEVCLICRIAYVSGYDWEVEPG